MSAPARRSPADLALRGGCALLGAMWLVAAASKAAHPEGAYEFTARVVGGGDGAKAAVTLVAAGEAFLGAAMVLGVVRGLLPTVVALVAATASLLWVRAEAGGKVHCGCLALLADSSVDEAIRRNAWLLAGVAVLFALAAVSRRRARGGAAACGPATPGP